MTDDPSGSAAESELTPVAGETTGPVARVRLWPAIVILVLEALAMFVPAMIAPESTLAQFMGKLVGSLGGTLAMLVWWLFASRAPWKIRGSVLLAFLVISVGAMLLVHESMWIVVGMYGFPLATALWVVCLASTGKWTWPARVALVALALLVSLGPWSALRCEGVDGSMRFTFDWRWNPAPEDGILQTLSEYEQQAGVETEPEVLAVEEAKDDDWPGFRGWNRDSIVAGVSIQTDWSAHPPSELWRRPVGPGWSSFAVVGQWIFTQEQRGEFEAVVCYDAATGRQLWDHQDETRFWEAMGGVGPRGTPTFDAGSLYTLGANGTLNCLEAASGRPVWTRNIADDAGAKVPQWGFAASPLIYDDLVVVWAGGSDGGVVAYDRHSGEPAWSCAAGKHSYSSPHSVRLFDADLILMMSDVGLTAVDALTGGRLSEHAWPMRDGPRIVQPALLDDGVEGGGVEGGRILVGTGYGYGTRLLRLSKSESGWQFDEEWTSRFLKPYFNDLVCHAGYCYGFDGRIMTCIDLATGDRVWKGGRYGHGQLLLLSDQDLLLVLSETGDVALVEASPEGFHELAKFHAFDGKTWNHPVVAHGKLFVRNSAEAVCYELSLKMPAGDVVETSPSNREPSTTPEP